MKKIENNFTVSGFVGKDAEIRQFANAKPEEWTDKDGVKHSRIIMVATKFYECPDKEETPAEEPAKPATKKGKK